MMTGHTNIDISNMIQQPQNAVDDIMQKQKAMLEESTQFTPYMYTSEYQCLMNYYIRFPWCIQQALILGEFSLFGIGHPDSHLIEQIEQQGQFYLNTYFQGYEIKILPAEYQKCENDTIYKVVKPYRLSVQKLEKVK